jgi:IrrE N-terminal-like domain
MRRGFKTEAKKLALEVRAELNLDAYGRFDPYALALEYGIPVYSLTELAEDQEAGRAVAHYAGDRASALSAVLVPLGAKRLIVENDLHAPVRRRNSISHEMSHIILEHEFSYVLLTSNGCRAIDREKEQEADWLAGELLIPYAAAERAARLDQTDEQVAQVFDVSTRLAAMRMNYSGARKVVTRKRAFAPRV